MSEALTDGRRFRILAVVDDFSRENLVLVADTSLSGQRVARELDQIIAERGMPKTIVSDYHCPAGDCKAICREGDSNHKFNIAPNLLDRNFSTDQPNKKWAGDITYIWTREG